MIELFGYLVSKFSYPTLTEKKTGDVDVRSPVVRFREQVRREAIGERHL